MDMVKYITVDLSIPQAAAPSTRMRSSLVRIFCVDEIYEKGIALRLNFDWQLKKSLSLCNNLKGLPKGSTHYLFE